MSETIGVEDFWDFFTKNKIHEFFCIYRIITKNNSIELEQNIIDKLMNKIIDKNDDRIFSSNSSQDAMKKMQEDSIKAKICEVEIYLKPT